MTAPTYAFGPIPSRRLGHSLGIDNIPAKVCSYACTYCQVGLTTEANAEPRNIYPPQEVADAVAARVAMLRERDEPIDYLSIVPSGEPTLDVNLGRLIELLRPLGVRIAVMTNGSLLWRPEVRERVGQADLVSVKVDTVDEILWRRLNHPHRRLDYDRMLAGVEAFASSYQGDLITETMLVEDLNDSFAAVTRTAAFVARLGPKVAYLAVPTRPPADAEARPPGTAVLVQAYRIFCDRVPRVEVLAGPSGRAFAATGDVRDDLLGVMAVHPLERESIEEILAKDGADWKVVEGLLAAGEVERVHYQGRTFYARPLGRL
ncbi:radical SAM protein [Haliangium sp.]|uniref:radical SAM protein n=1 Tax=Haliangium sp. TaxID=2663208 RepID=UPI003D12D37A